MDKKIYKKSELVAKGYMPMKTAVFTLEELIDNYTDALKKGLKLKKSEIKCFAVSDTRWQWFLKPSEDKKHCYAHLCENWSAPEEVAPKPKSKADEINEQGRLEPIISHDALIKEGYVSTRTGSMDKFTAMAMRGSVAIGLNVPKEHIQVFRTGENAWDLYLGKTPVVGE